MESNLSQWRSQQRSCGIKYGARRVSCVEGQTRATTEQEIGLCFIDMKIFLSAFMILFATSAAMANDLETSPAGTQSAIKWSDYPDHMQTRGRPLHRIATTAPIGNASRARPYGVSRARAESRPQPPPLAFGSKATPMPPGCRTSTQSNRLASIPLLILRDTNARPNTGQQSAAPAS
jgi:hypothetical protein